MTKRIVIGAVLVAIILGGICAWQKARIGNVADAIWRKVAAQSVEERVATIEARKPHLKQLADNAGERLVILVFKTRGRDEAILTQRRRELGCGACLGCVRLRKRQSGGHGMQEAENRGLTVCYGGG